MLKGRKGQLNGVLNVTFVVIFALAFLAIAFYFLQSVIGLDNFYEQASTVNETEAWINTTGYTVDAEASDGEKTGDFVLTSIWNATDSGAGNYNISLALGNATIDSATGVVANASTTTYDNVSISYSYKEGQEGWTGVNQTIDAFLTIPGLMALLVLVVISAIVIGVMSGWSSKEGTGA